MSSTTAGVAPRHRVLEAALLAAASLAALVVYRVVHARVYDSSAYIDPWLYTGMFRDFSALYRHLYGTYYASRLPWIIPGYAINSVFGPHVSFFVLHVPFFFGAALAAWGLARRLFGPIPAFVAYVGLIANPLFYDAYTTDYPDGAVITFLLLAMFFGLTAPAQRRRSAWLAAAGFFLAAAVFTNLWTTVFVAALVPVYLLLVWEGELRTAARVLVRDLRALVAGAFVVAVGCAAFAIAYGGSPFFFRGSVVAALTLNGSPAAKPSGGWAWDEPRLATPPLLLLALLILLPRLRSFRCVAADRALRAAYAALAFLALTIGFYLLWDAAFHGTVISTYYYYDQLLPAFAFALAAIVHLLFRGVRDRRVPGILAAGTAALVAVAFLPVLVVYAWGQQHVVGRAGMWWSALPFGLALGSVLVLRFRSALVAAVGASALLVAGPAFGSAASVSTQSAFATSASTRATDGSLLRLFPALHRWANGNLPSSELPQFWYDEASQTWLRGLVSTYFYEYGFVGNAMPKLDAKVLSLLRERRPQYLTLLCRTDACAGAPAVLRRAGYLLRPGPHTRISEGTLAIDVRSYALSPPTA